jgi:hypothetical protein
LMLLTGSGTDLQPISTIGEGFANNGSFAWAPSAMLHENTTGYALSLIDNETRQSQYSSLFLASRRLSSAIRGISYLPQFRVLGSRRRRHRDLERRHGRCGLLPSLVHVLAPSRVSLLLLWQYFGRIDWDGNGILRRNSSKKTLMLTHSIPNPSWLGNRLVS